MDLVVWLTQPGSVCFSLMGSVERGRRVLKEVTGQVPPAVKEAYLLSRQGASPV